jgi:hypothetical protein
VAAELAKQQVNSGGRVELYYFRDQQGLEVDFIVPRGPRRLALIETKSTTTPTPAMARPLVQLAGATLPYACDAFVVHAGTASVAGRALAPGVAAATLPQLLDELA